MVLCVSGCTSPGEREWIRAHQIDGVTTIALPVENQLKGLVEARVDLAWLSPKNKIDARAEKTLMLAPGQTAIELPLPLSKKMEPLTERLQYSIKPNYANLTSFAEIQGIESLANIADYAFSVRAVSLAESRPGEAIEVRIIATNPISGRPVSGVTVTRGDASGVTDENGIAILKSPLPAKRPV